MVHPSLPHHRLVAWELAIELAKLVASIRIGDADNRKQARDAASSCGRNIAEAAGKGSAADARRVFAIARAECIECVAAVEIAGAIRTCNAVDVERVVTLGARLSAVLGGLT
jgi:four helix bundle protein